MPKNLILDNSTSCKFYNVSLFINLLTYLLYEFQVSFFLNSGFRWDDGRLGLFVIPAKAEIQFLKIDQNIIGTRF